MPGAARMIAGTSSQSNSQSSNAGRKSASSPARFQSSPRPSSDSGRRSSAMKLNACRPSGEVGDRVADELLIAVSGPHHRASVEHGLDLGDPTPEQRSVPAAVGPSSGYRCARATLWMPSAATTASAATTTLVVAVRRGRHRADACARRRRPRRAGGRGGAGRLRRARRTRRAAPAGARRGGSTAAATDSRPRARVPPARSPGRAASSTRGSRARSSGACSGRRAAHRVELAHRVREQVDADAERPHVAGTLSYTSTLDTDLVEARAR